MYPKMRCEKALFPAKPMVGIAFATGLVILAFLGGPMPGHGQGSGKMEITSASFTSGGPIPSKFSCEGADLSPQLSWQKAPTTAKSFAIVMHDPDAPVDFTHWLVYNIPAGTHGLAEGASGTGAMPAGSAEGTNHFGRLGYGGPCPPPGKVHHYIFRFYALDTRLNLSPGVDRRQLEAAIERHIVAEGQIIGTYQRGSH